MSQIFYVHATFCKSLYVQFLYIFYFLEPRLKSISNWILLYIIIELLSCIHNSKTFSTDCFEFYYILELTQKINMHAFIISVAYSITSIPISYVFRQKRKSHMFIYPNGVWITLQSNTNGVNCITQFLMGQQIIFVHWSMQVAAERRKTIKWIRARQ